MAEAIGLAASLLGIAGVGVSIVTTLSKFKDLYLHHDVHIDSLSVKVSITSSILTQLGNVVQPYEKEFHILEDNFQKVKQSCGKDFETLRMALRMMKPDDSAEIGALKTKPARQSDVPKGAKFFSWEKLKWAMGGADKVDILMVSLESSKSNLQLLLESTNLLILKRLDQR
jgi:hypothetical protein